METADSRKVMSAVLPVFFLSGGCALVYEVLWTRYLADLMGGTSLSTLVVLMVFMGGLSLGAMLIGRLVDRAYNGLRVYGYLEAGVGLYAILFPLLFSGVSAVFQMIGARLTPGSSGLLALKIVTACLLISVPAVAIGGTLPAITRYLTSSRQVLRRNISLLYGINSLGAVIGVLAGGFYLVHNHGMSRSMIIVGIVNLLLGIAALAGARFFERRQIHPESDTAPLRRQEEQQDFRIYKPYTAKRAIIAAGLSGFAAMALQVAWIRYFVIILGATHSAFTIVVAAFIFGIGLGSLLVGSKLFARWPLQTVLAAVFALAAATMGLGLFFYARVPFEIARALSIIARTSLAWPVYEFMKFSICFMLMLLPTMASGMILPVCVRIAGRGEERIGRDVAMVYTVNTLGALLGIAFTSQFLFRVMSLPLTLRVIFFIYLGTALFLTFILKERGRKRIFALVTVLIVAHLTLWRPWPPQQLFISNVDFTQMPRFEYEDFRRQNEQQVLVEERQGADVQAVVLDVFRSRVPFRSLIINGKPDASNDPQGPDLVTEVLLAHLPMLLHPFPARVFVLGAGSGITSGEALKHYRVQQVVTVELAAEVFEVSKHFAADNGRYWENPKHRMVIDDGKTFLQLSREKFDVIALEPTNVWQEGMAGLFSEDFFRMAKARLAEGGIIAQWLHTYQVDDLTVNIVLKTFSRVFPKASIFEMESGDILLVGYDDKWRFDPLKMEHNFYRPQILRSLEMIDVFNPPALLLREIMSRSDFRRYTEVLTAPVNTINFPILEEAAEYGHFIDRPPNFLQDYDSRLNSDGDDLLVNDYFKRLGSNEIQIKAVIESKLLAKKDILRESLNFRIMEKFLHGPKALPVETLMSRVSDLMLREVLTHPYYRVDAEKIDPNEAYGLLNGELVLWGRAASQLWTPQPERMKELFDRFAAGVDEARAGRVARDIALSLARSRACGAAMPYFRIAAERGLLDSNNMNDGEIITAFYCEVREGEPVTARFWLEEIEARGIPLMAEMLADKATLKIKMGGSPPPVVYGKLPSRW